MTREDEPQTVLIPLPSPTEVSDHGGERACECQEGEGTVFRVRLPVAANLDTGTV